MKRFILLIFFSLIFAVYSPQTFATSDVTISTTIPDLSFNPPLLIHPGANAGLNNTRPYFSWSRPSPLPTIYPLSHYDLYLDGIIFADSLSDNLTKEEYYYHTATASSGTFYLNLKTDLSQGYHYWSVTAITSAGTSSSASIRTFYIDSIPPFISLTKLNQQLLNWHTNFPNTIPDTARRNLSTTTQNPVLSGTVESGANLQIILICPQNIPNCHNRIYTANIIYGLWQLPLPDLIPGQMYPIRISATDAGGNSVFFPDFSLTYSSASTSPILRPSSIPPESITPPNEFTNVLNPTGFTPMPPAIPSPPPLISTTHTTFSLDSIYGVLLFLLVFGLPLHLITTMISFSTPLKLTPQFLYILALPFLRKRVYQTVPFCYIHIYQEDNLTRPWQTQISDIKGQYNLQDPLPNKMYLSFTANNKEDNKCLITAKQFSTTCLNPLPKSHPNGSRSLHQAIHDYRIIPLIFAVTTSLPALIIKPTAFLLAYFYLSIQYLYSEYIYPNL